MFFAEPRMWSTQSSCCWLTCPTATPSSRSRPPSRPTRPAGTRWVYSYPTISLTEWYLSTLKAMDLDRFWFSLNFWLTVLSRTYALSFDFKQFPLSLFLFYPPSWSLFRPWKSWADCFGCWASCRGCQPLSWPSRRRSTGLSSVWTPGLSRWGIACFCWIHTGRSKMIA